MASTGVGELKLVTIDEYEKIATEVNAELNLGTRDRDVRKKGGDDLAMGYGEVTFRFMRWFIEEKRIGMSKDDVFIDVGSGVGNVIIFISAVMGIDTIGMDINPSLTAIADVAKTAIDRQLRARNFYTGNVQFITGDATRELPDWPKRLLVRESTTTSRQSTLVLTPRRGTIVFIDNLIIDNFTTRAMIDRMAYDGHIAPGARLVLMKPLLWGRPADDDTMRLFDFAHRPPVVLTTPRDATSWSCVQFYPVLYTFAAERNTDVLFRARYRRSYLAMMLQQRPKNLGERY